MINYVCPLCGDDNITIQEDHQQETTITQLVKCHECHNQWIEVYELKERHILTTNEILENLISKFSLNYILTYIDDHYPKQFQEHIENIGFIHEDDVEDFYISNRPP